MIRIPYGRHSLDEADVVAVTDLLRNSMNGGYLTQGPVVVAFEQAFANYVGARFAVAVSNGTCALHLACKALGVTKDDNVITTPNTFVATANSALYEGANPHFVDIDSSTLNISTAGLEAKINELGRAKALMPVHFAGLPCDMPEIKRLADSVNAVVIEDACHALGAEYATGGRVGCCAYSDVTAFSLHPVKMIAAGEGGVLTTNDEAVCKELLRLRSHGINKGNDEFLYQEDAMENGQVNPWYYEMQELGFNYRITDIQCALAMSQLKKLPKFLQRRKELVAAYDAVFAQSDAPSQPAQTRNKQFSAHHLYVINIDFDALGQSRAQVMEELKVRGIGTQVHYVPVYRQPFYRDILSSGFTDYPSTESYYSSALSLPLYAAMSDGDQQEVVMALRDIGCI